MSRCLDSLLDVQRRADCERNDAARRAEEEALAVCDRLTQGDVKAAREHVAARREHAS